MPRDHKEGSRRRSFFGISSVHSHGKDDEEPANLLRKRRTASFMSNFSGAKLSFDDDGSGSNNDIESPVYPVKPQIPRRGSGNRPSSVFTSLRSLRLSDDPDEPLSATSVRSPMSRGSMDDTGRNRHVLHYGEVQTSSSMFRKKKEYLVLTETHLIRFKNHQKAAEAFSSIPSPYQRMPSARHGQTSSAGSGHELQDVASETSGDRDLGTPLRQIVAVYHLDDGRPYFAIEVAYLDDDTNHASTMTLQFGDPDDMFGWLAIIREAANQVRLTDLNPISPYNSHLAARVVEGERDYVPPNYAIYKVVQRPLSKTGTRASSDDLSKVTASVCFLAIGVHKVHIIPLFKPPAARSSSPALHSLNTNTSYGILALTELKVSETDDTFEITFRTPLQKPKVLHLASLASRDIAVRLRYVEENLRPEWESRPYHFIVPDEVKYDILSQSSPHINTQDSLDRTLIGYCVAYDINPENIRYQINHPPEDYPRFELLSPVGLRRDYYTPLELLAVMRSLRYNEGFGGISFKDVKLDGLNGLEDRYGSEHVCSRTKRGTAVPVGSNELGRACLLVQEIRALAMTSRKLRRMDFTSCISRKTDLYSHNRGGDIGCGIVEALFPLCKTQTTNVDWIILNNIHLSSTDLDYLVAAAVERACHFRGLELSKCDLDDRGLFLLLDSLRAQENTLEALDLSANPCRLSPSTFDSQIGVFGFLRKLNLAHLSRAAGPESLITLETFQAWRLQELILSGTSMSQGMVDAIASYLVNYKQSSGLRELKLDHCYLTGRDVAYLLHSMTEQPGKPRELHLDVSENYIERDLDHLTDAIARGYAPTSLTIRLMEFDEEGAFRKMVLALAKNSTIRNLDISRASLPCAASDETCRALEQMFAENSTLEYLDISGEDSRLETTKLGVGINKALQGLQKNKSLRVLFIQYQKLGLQGASTLADVLKVNNTLLELHCENNDISLGGFTDLVNSLTRNTTLLYLPAMEESRQIALKRTEDEVKQARDDKTPLQSRTGSVRSKISNKVHGRPAKDRIVSMTLTDQDVKAALSLVDESWQRQVFRLQKYLQRNYNIANGIPTTMEVDEEYERPGTADSLNRIVEKVKFETTPTLEKQAQLGDEGRDVLTPMHVARSGGFVHNFDKL